MTTRMTTTTSMESFPWWLYLSKIPGNCPKQCALLCLIVPVNFQTLTSVYGPWMDPPGGNAPPLLLENCALVIPLSKLIDMCLKLISQAYCEMCRKDFLGYDLTIAREPQMCPPQVLHSQCLESTPQMIPSSESDEEPGKICAFPSSQLV
jgi:hypothetical protein